MRNPDKPERAEAENGAHDDCVMALAIAHYARGQQSMKVKKKDGAPKRKWTSDMWEDYRRANAEQRAYLRQKWGNPE